MTAIVELPMWAVGLIAVAWGLSLALNGLQAIVIWEQRRERRNYQRAVHEVVNATANVRDYWRAKYEALEAGYLEAMEDS